MRILLAGASGCATFLGAVDGAPSTPEAWKAYVKRWAKPSERAVREHARRRWQCDEIAAKPVGYGALVDDVGARTPRLEWAAAGCGRDGHYFVTCPVLVASVPPGKVACDVRRKQVVALGLPALANEVGGVVIVDDDAAPATPSVR